MKNRKNIYIAAALLVAGVVPTGAQTGNSPISVACNDLMQKGDSLYIDATIRVKGDLIESRKSLTLTPLLESAEQKEGLPSILLNGKNRAKVYKREVALKNLQDEPRYQVLRASDASEHTIPYKMVIAWEPWMKDARFILAQDLCGCGKEEAVGPLLIADKIRMAPTERYKVQPTLAYISPEAETEKHRAEVGTAYLDFQVGKSQILPDFRNNASELDKINSTIRSVNDFPQSFFTLENEPEDWAGFKAQAEADYDMPARDEVLSIINSDLQPDQKEAKLRALKSGSAFSYVLKNIFPSLRRSEYRIDYTVREFTVEEGREIIKTRPQQLSLSEMFAVANSYETGSKEYNDVFEIAVRMYSSDPVANLNAANISIGKGDYESAKKYLSKAGNSAEAIHARGVIKLIEGDLDGAETLLKQAKEAGVIDAAANLRELQKKRDDNALFDSFNMHN